MMSTIRNTAHADHISDMLEYSLTHGNHSDVVISVSDTKRTIRCHKTVLASASPLLKALVTGRPEDESIHIKLCETSYNEAMAMLNLVYTGRVNINTKDLSGTQSVISMLKLPILTGNSIQAAAKDTAEEEPHRKRYKKRIKPQVDPKANAKRPLMMKMGGIQPVFFVLPVGVPPGGKLPENVNSLLTPNTSVAPQQESQSALDVDVTVNSNSYQRAKSRDAVRFRCDICMRGFPLACLLKRHKMIHSDKKPFSCRYCDKSFTTKAAFQHHEFARHLEDKAAQMEKDELAKSRTLGQAVAVQNVGRLEQVQLLRGREQPGEQVQQGEQVQMLRGRAQTGEQVTQGEQVQVVQKGENLEVQAQGRQSEQVQIIDVQDITQQITVQISENSAKKDNQLALDPGRDMQSFTEEPATIIEVVDTDSLNPTDTGVVTMDSNSQANRQYLTYTPASTANHFQSNGYQVAYIQSGNQFYI